MITGLVTIFCSLGSDGILCFNLPTLRSGHTVNRDQLPSEHGILGLLSHPHMPLISPAASSRLGTRPRLQTIRAEPRRLERLASPLHCQQPAQIRP